MTYLVTGCAGFIGSSFADRILREGEQVLGIDSFTTNYSRELKKSNINKLLLYPNFTFINDDILNLNLNTVFKEIRIVYHFAGQPSVPNSWGAEFSIYSSRNINLTQKLLDAAISNDIEHFIYSSSSSIYGKMEDLVDEKVTPNPISPYGVTKLAGENLVNLYGTEFGLKTVSLRYFTVYGPRQRPDMAFYKLISAAKYGKDFMLLGDGSQIRDFTFIDDVVEANILAVNKDLPPGTFINIGGGAPASMNHAIEIIQNEMQKKINIKKLPLGPGNPLKTSANRDLARNLLGWEPNYDLYNGLVKQIKWQTQL